MSDFSTKDIVVWILGNMGLNKLKEDAEKGNNLDVYVRYIKFKSKNYQHMQECINYFL